MRSVVLLFGSLSGWSSYKMGCGFPFSLEVIVSV